MPEERIYIGVGKDGGEPIYFNHFTREEAIERMAKAVIKKGTGNDWENNGAVYRYMYKDLAEAALDSLLKGG